MADDRARTQAPTGPETSRQADADVRYYQTGLAIDIVGGAISARAAAAAITPALALAASPVRAMTTVPTPHPAT